MSLRLAKFQGARIQTNRFEKFRALTKRVMTPSKSEIDSRKAKNRKRHR